MKDNKTVINFRIAKEILDAINAYRLKIFQLSGFKPTKTTVIEKAITLGLIEMEKQYDKKIKDQL